MSIKLVPRIFQETRQGRTIGKQETNEQTKQQKPCEEKVNAASEEKREEKTSKSTRENGPIEPPSSTHHGF